MSVIQSNNNEKYQFFGKLSGMILHNQVCMEDKCDAFVFKNKSWFSPTISHQLFGPVEQVLNVLSPYYEITTIPSPGYVAVYCDEGIVTHFGIIKNTDRADSPMIQSKFGEMYAYTHPIEGILPYYGERVVFLKERN